MLSCPDLPRPTPNEAPKIKGNNSPEKTGKGFSPPKKIKKEEKKRKEKGRVEVCVARVSRKVSICQLCNPGCKDCLSWGCGREGEGGPIVDASRDII